MAAMPASPVPTISPAEMQILISRSGLVLNPGQMADLVLAWRQVAGLIAAIPQGRPLADDLAYSFRLPPATLASGPAAGAAASGSAGSGAAARAAPKRAGSAAAKPTARPTSAKPTTTTAKSTTAKSTTAKSTTAKSTTAAAKPGTAKPAAKALASRGKAAARPQQAAKPKPRTARRRASSGR
jgi:hypothetical protein